MKNKLMAVIPTLMLAGALGMSTLPTQVTATAAQAATGSEQATQAALAAVPGAVLSVQLEDEDGIHAYGVIIQAADGSGQWDVKVSTDGQVIKQEPDNDDGGESEGDESEDD